MWLLLYRFVWGLSTKKIQTCGWGHGICVALTGFFYWYYAYFFVICAGLIVVSALLLKQRIQWRQIGLAASISWLVISPLAILYWQNWNLVPGVDEGAFPAPDAFADAMTLSGSWLVPFGRTAGVVQSVPTLCLTVLGCLQLRIG